MTCVGPGVLVDKYREYAHGNPKGRDRRIVLDETFKERVKDVLVFQPDDLLERFTSYSSEASKDVKGTNRPILILMFAHGIEKTFHLTIGGAGEYERCRKLDRDTFRQALLRHNPNPNVAVFTTMCFGGGWAQSTCSNMSTMAGVDERTQQLSWPKSESTSKYCGSRYASAVANALIRKIKGLNLNSNKGEEVLRSETYTSLEATIHHILTKEIDVRERSQILFSAEDDLWCMEWRARTGFPLSGYQEKWEALALVREGNSGAHNRTASVIAFPKPSLYPSQRLSIISDVWRSIISKATLETIPPRRTTTPPPAAAVYEAEKWPR